MTQVQEDDAKAELDESLEAQRRRQLLRAAMECVAEAGVGRTTMRMIADRAGVTTGMVLYYYRSKKELISAAVTAATEEFSARMNVLTDGTFGPKRLEAILQTHLSDPAEGIPRNFSVQFRAASLGDPELRQTTLAEYEAAREKLGRSIRSGQEQNELRADIDDMLAADLILVLMQGLAMEEALIPEIVSRERASQIGLLALSFLARDTSPQAAASASVTAPAVSAAAGPTPMPSPLHQAPVETADLIEAALVADPRLSRETAKELADSFKALYRIALRTNR